MAQDLHLENIRREYSSRSLSRKELPDDPLEMVDQWLNEALETKVNEPTAMIVATATPDGRPSVRTVLLKEVVGGRFVFYSNYESRKGRQMAENPHVAVTFLWHELERQIHVEGTVTRLSSEESDAYFAMRPYKSRVGARISPQSQPMTPSPQSSRFGMEHVLPFRSMMSTSPCSSSFVISSTISNPGVV